MKVEVRVLAMEAEISINEETGDYNLELRLELSDGSERILERSLKHPKFRVELSEGEKEEETSSGN